jgi:hypothetical protein
MGVLRIVFVCVLGDVYVWHAAAHLYEAAVLEGATPRQHDDHHKQTMTAKCASARLWCEAS